MLEILEDIPFDTDADLIGISTMGHGVIRSLDIARKFKEAGKTVILGGYMASIMAEEALKHCDCVVVGDAELVWQDLIRDYEAGRLKKLWKNLERGFFSPPPRFDLIKKKISGTFCPSGSRDVLTLSFSVACLYKGHI